MVKKNKIKKSQSFSTDILVVIAILLFGVLFVIVNKVDTEKNQQEDINKIIEETSAQGELIIDELKNEQVIDSKENINVNNLKQIDLEKLKEELNIKGDFCISFEKNGNLVKIDPENNINGIGSEDIIVNNQKCISS